MKEKKPKRITIEVTAKQHKEVKARAGEMDMSMTDFVKRAIDLYTDLLDKKIE